MNGEKEEEHEWRLPWALPEKELAELLFPHTPGDPYATPASSLTQLYSQRVVATERPGSKGWGDDEWDDFQNKVHARVREKFEQDGGYVRFHEYVANPPKVRIKRPQGVTVEPPSNLTAAGYQAALAAGDASTSAEAEEAGASE